MDSADFNQFSFTADDLRDMVPFMTENMEGVEALVVDDEVIAIELPDTVELPIVESAPACAATRPPAGPSRPPSPPATSSRFPSTLTRVRSSASTPAPASTSVGQHEEIRMPRDLDGGRLHSRTPLLDVEEPSMIKRVGIISIPVTDQDRAKAFYVDKLGLLCLADAPFGEGGGGSRWALRCRDDPEPCHLVRRHETGRYFRVDLRRRRHRRGIQTPGRSRRRVRQAPVQRTVRQVRAIAGSGREPPGPAATPAELVRFGGPGSSERT